MAENFYEDQDFSQFSQSIIESSDEAISWALANAPRYNNEYYQDLDAITTQIDLNINLLSGLPEKTSDVIKIFYKTIEWATHTIEDLKAMYKDKRGDTVQSIMKAANKTLPFLLRIEEILEMCFNMASRNENEALRSISHSRGDRIMFMSKIMKDLKRSNNFNDIVCIFGFNQGDNTRHYITISGNTIGSFEEASNKIFEGDNYTEIKSGSDEVDNYFSEQVNSPIFEWHHRDKDKPSNRGSFFQYVNQTPFDLSQFMVYDEDQLEDKTHRSNVTKYPCFIYALKELGVDTDRINLMLTSVTGNEFAFCNIPEFCRTHGINVQVIKVTARESKNNYQIHEIGDSMHMIGSIVLFKDHYFVNKPIPITKFAIEHWREILAEPRVKKEKMWLTKRLPSGKRSPEYTMGSIMKAAVAIPKMFKYGWFEQMKFDESLMSAFSNPSTIKAQPVDQSEWKKTKPIDKILKRCNKNFAKHIPKERTAKEIEKKPKVHPPPRYQHVIFADTEATTDPTVNKNDRIPHKAYCVAMQICRLNVEDNGDIPINYQMTDHDWNPIEEVEGPHIDVAPIKFFYGKHCIKRFLLSIPEGSLIYFHNVKYDLAFLRKYLYRANVVEKDSFLYSLEANIMVGRRHKRVKFVDSYKIIPIPLAAFASTFQLSIKKEVYPYNFYKRANSFDKSAWTIARAANTIEKEEDRKTFITLVEELKEAILNNPSLCESDNDNLHMSNPKYFPKECYARFYCEQDVRVLMQGFMIFRKNMFDILRLDSLKFISLSSMADTYMHAEGVYEGCTELTGVVRQFIQQCNKGGRVMCRENKKKIVSGIIDYFDAVSLYPSAMARLTEDHIGFPLGAPSMIINAKQFEEIKALPQAYYYVRIYIKKVGRHLAMPILSNLVGGIRSYTNEDKREHYCDRIELEDLVKYQEIEYDFIDGYYFWSGNFKIGESITHLFNCRLQAKAEAKTNPALNAKQECIKLIMNSSYGKNGLKPTNYKYVYFDDKEKADQYLIDNASLVTAIDHFGSKIRIKSGKTINNHFNRCHISSVVLSMSKRIMNELIVLAEDMGIEIFYQDTDSIFLRRENRLDLEKRFTQKYNRPLVGPSMGQFHCDFTIRGCDTPHSELSIFNGKKNHAHFITGINAKGEKISETHFRAKGIPESCFRRKAIRENILIKGLEKTGSIMGLFESLNQGNVHAFNLADKDGAVISVNGFLNITLQVVPRCLQFKGPAQQYIDDEGNVKDYIKFVNDKGEVLMLRQSPEP